MPSPKLSRREFCRHGLSSSLSAAAVVGGLPMARFALAAEDDMGRRPRVPGKFKLRARSRRETKASSGRFEVVVEDQFWDVSETAIIICDMWSDHPCHMAAVRVDAMAARMNQVVSAARSHGAQIIHAPSGGVQFYDGTPYRERMKSLPAATPPVPLKNWCHLDPDREGPLPIDDSDGGCDDPEVKEKPDFDRRQHPAIKMAGYDGVSDSGQEIYNLLVYEGVKNVALMGVHTNMCVLGRPFGIRQMCYVGMNVVLARDLTDAMYNPRRKPLVSHTRGTELVIEHVERYWCPSILGEDLTRVAPGPNDPATG